MASDLWGPSFPEEESSSCIQPEWQHDFYYGYGIDMLEENALNEKSCVQVLRILITKADTEIDELEKDLVLLQNELAWAEHEEWHDICCNALRAKIDCLDISISKLRNKDENDIEVYLLMHTEPAEKLHEIMKALLKSFCHEKKQQNEQCQDVVVLDSRSASPEQLAAQHKNQKSSSSDSCFISKGENNGPNVAPQEKCTSSNPSTLLEVKKAYSSETVANTDVQDLMAHSLLPAAGQFDEKKVVTIIDLETTKKHGIKECSLTLKDKNVIQHLSPKSAQKRMRNLDRSKVKKPAAQFVNNSDLVALKHSAGHLKKKRKKKKKKLSASSLNFVSEEATTHASISAADMLILDSSSNSMGMTAVLGKKEKDEQPANIVAKDFGSTAHKQTTGDSNKMKMPCKHDLKVNGCEVQGLYTTTIRKSNISNSCSEHKGNIQKPDKLANAVVKTISPDALRHASGLNGKENNSDSRLSAFGQKESLKFDMEQKLCDFAVKSARKQGIKEVKVASTDKNQHSNSLVKGEEKRKDSLQVVTRRETALSDNELSALTSVIELQDERGKDKTIQRMEGKLQIEEVQMAEIAASDDKPDTNLYMRLQREKVKTVKTNTESTAADVEEPGLNSKENVSNSSPFPKGKRTWKTANIRALNYSLTGKIIKKTVQQSQSEVEEQTTMMLDASQDAMSLPQKKCKKLSSVPIVVEIRGSSLQMNISKLHRDLNRSITKTDFGKSGTSVDDSCTQLFDASNLMKMKLCDLRAMAKSQKLTKYSALKKEDLVKRLENRLSC